MNAGGAPPLLFDYGGFPPHTYRLTWPAPSSPELAKRICGLLQAAGIESGSDASRGWDHGVFVPLKVVFPRAEIPTVQLSSGTSRAQAKFDDQIVAIAAVAGATMIYSDDQHIQKLEPRNWRSSVSAIFSCHPARRTARCRWKLSQPRPPRAADE